MTFSVYVPGTEELDLKKYAMSLQQIGGRLVTAEGNITTLQVPACFSAHKNGTSQAGVADVTFTQVTFGTEVYDVGSHFASSTWTPPAGKVSLSAAILIAGTVTTGNQLALSIYKNGSGFAQGNAAMSSIFGGGGAFISCNDIANGTDAYTVYVYADLDSGTGTINGGTQNTFFCGHWISA